MQVKGLTDLGKKNIGDKDNSKKRKLVGSSKSENFQEKILTKELTRTRTITSPQMGKKVRMN
jgi:hypothetical protein